MFTRLHTIALIVLPFLLLTASAADPNPDPFAAGAVWVGEFKVAVKGSAVQKWVLTVAERNGGTFKGEIIGKNPAGEVETAKVEGTATAKSSGAVVFKTEKKGLAQAMLRGRLTNGEVVLTFSGTDKLGKPAAGVATLKPRN